MPTVFAITGPPDPSAAPSSLPPETASLVNFGSLLVSLAPSVGFFLLGYGAGKRSITWAAGGAAILFWRRGQGRG